MARSVVCAIFAPRQDQRAEAIGPQSVIEQHSAHTMRTVSLTMICPANEDRRRPNRPLAIAAGIAWLPDNARSDAGHRGTGPCRPWRWHQLVGLPPPRSLST